MRTEILTNIYKYGEGAPLYIVNGGPGLEYSYMKDFFMPLTNEREIIFYDQTGTGKDFDMNIQISSVELTQQLIELLKNDRRRKDIVAHSWGAYLAISALSTKDINMNIDKVIFINPFALNYERYEKSGQRLFSRFPQSVLRQIETFTKINTKEGYLQMLQLIAPYYTHQPNQNYLFNFESYNSPMEDGVYGSISGFDQVPFLSQIEERIYIIKCDDDFISIDDTAELQKIAKKYVVLTECGHFPFIEQKEKCYQYLLDFLHDS